MEDTSGYYDVNISFRGKKYCVNLCVESSYVLDIKNHVIASFISEDDTASIGNLEIQPSDLKLIYKGKILNDDNESLKYAFGSKISKTKPIKIMAMGVSSQEAEKNRSSFEQAKLNTPRIRDDLSQAGKDQIMARLKLGRQMLDKAAQKESKHSTQKYGFHRIESLPMLPDQDKAKEILNSLANDPGILACMEKHHWNVGCLAEMYPEGKVGESEVCIMGLNQNKGQKILLRLRTDDLKGFRKILSIRKVLFHELAHNVHSEHDGEFFKLMRQIEQECNEMNWTKDGVALGGSSASGNYYTAEMNDNVGSNYVGGTYRLGGDANSSKNMLTRRELAARAALMRMSKEEEEIEEACGCNVNRNQPILTESKTTSNDDIEDDDRT